MNIRWDASGERVHGFLGTLLTKVVDPTNNEAERQLREREICREICLFIQSETGRKFIETIFSVSVTNKKIAVNPLDYIKACIESFRLNRPPSTHPGMVQTNSSGLLNSLYPFMPKIP